jgi:hypothetical protein
MAEILEYAHATPRKKGAWRHRLWAVVFFLGAWASGLYSAIVTLGLIAILIFPRLNYSTRAEILPVFVTGMVACAAGFALSYCCVKLGRRRLKQSRDQTDREEASS